MENIKKAALSGKAAVIGTTGLSDEDFSEIRNIAGNIPCVLAPNMSVGVNVMFKIAAEMAKILGREYDIEVIEAHHRMKKDAPSGTAVGLAKRLAEATERDFDKAAVYARKGMIGERAHFPVK